MQRLASQSESPFRPKAVFSGLLSMFNLLADAAWSVHLKKLLHTAALNAIPLLSLLSC
jgi:hypothetical protein